MPLAADIPVEGLEGGILFSGLFYADRARRVAWIWGGREDSPRIYLLRIGYGEALDGGLAPVTLFYTDLLDDLSVLASSAMLPDGSFVGAGGIFPSRHDNYNPRAVAYHFMPEGGESWLPAKKSRLPWLLGLLCGILTGVAAIFVGLWLYRSMLLKKTKPFGDPGSAALSSAEPSLMARITALMEEQEYYRRKGLTLNDVAQALGTNTNYVSKCINASTGGSFTDFVNGYRVRYAQALLLDHPEALLSDVCDQAGFSSDASFFRNFKALTGMTPAQWVQSHP